MQTEEETEENVELIQETTESIDESEIIFGCTTEEGIISCFRRILAIGLLSYQWFDLGSDIIYLAESS